MDVLTILRQCGDTLRSEAINALPKGTFVPTGLVLDKIEDGTPHVRVFEVLDPRLRMLTLRQAVEETQALGVACVVDGEILIERARRDAVLLVVIPREGNPIAEALPYVLSALGPPRFFPAYSVPLVARRYQSQVFGP